MHDDHDFDPNAAATGKGIFGLPERADARIRLLGVPFEATTSFGGGTREGPRLMLEASQQVDLLDAHFASVWRHGIVLEALDTGPTQSIAELDEEARASQDPDHVQELSAARTSLVEAWTRATFAN
ncbi:MAG TPA: arginase family protein, partial [Planctomycetota bacterium]|nr:arginase family protein [Planctomycetota bacterium]